jgi:hypothetical protein
MLRGPPNDLDSLHVEGIPSVGCSNLDIIDEFPFVEGMQTDVLLALLQSFQSSIP